MAMLIQHLSGKLGIATGMNLPETIPMYWRRWASLALWGIAELSSTREYCADGLEEKHDVEHENNRGEEQGEPRGEPSIHQPGPLRPAGA